MYVMFSKDLYGLVSHRSCFFLTIDPHLDSVCRSQREVKHGSPKTSVGSSFSVCVQCPTWILDRRQIFFFFKLLSGPQFLSNHSEMICVHYSEDSSLHCNMEETHVIHCEAESKCHVKEKVFNSNMSPQEVKDSFSQLHKSGHHFVFCLFFFPLLSLLCSFHQRAKLTTFVLS